MCTINDCEDVFCDAIDEAPEGTFDNAVPELQAIIGTEYVTPEELAKALVRWIRDKLT